MATIGTKIHTMLFGKFVGSDEFGNRYYTRKTSQGEKRWVMYNGKDEPSKVPPLWHGWLHYTLDEVPSASTVKHYKWEKQHLPNLTGTAGAYVPPGHIRRGAEREPSTSDYTAWKPR